jgi:formate hydrogenlyase transcriptional activator
MTDAGADPTSPAEAARYRTLLEINNAVISSLTREDLFLAIAGALRRVVPFERTAIFLPDRGNDVLRLFILQSSLPTSYFAVGMEMLPGESHVGWAFQNQRYLLCRDLGRERRYPMEERAYQDGVRSYVLVPLVAQGRSVGVLAVASTSPDQYSESDAEFLQEAANQIVLAVENMKAYEAITTLNRDVREEAARRREVEETLRAVVEGTATMTGSDFFFSLVKHLASALNVRYIFVSECVEGGEGRVRTRAFWNGEGFGENFEYDVTGSPCLRVLDGEIAHYGKDVQRLFPDDKDLVALGAESYLGVPVLDPSGPLVGHLVILDDKPMPDTTRALPILRTFASRAGAELARLRADERLRAALAEVEMLRNRLQAENVYLQDEIHSEHNFDEMVGSSLALLEVLRKTEQVAPTDSTVLVYGETGTGKELIARAIHRRSPRRERPLVKVNSSAISAGLVESELFGHVKGAFTGAIEKRIGRFALADHGTIFLDEVGELPLETQVKLLRVLQEQEFEPVGSNQTVRVDVRVIAATNRDLEEAVRAGRFRADLFYRLNVFPLRVPPLRERTSDIPQLAMFFLSRFAKRFGRQVDTIASETMERLVSYPWPGNIRELQNVIERAVVLSRGPALELDKDLLPAPVGLGPEPGVERHAERGRPVAKSAASGLAAALEETERAHIVAALESADGVIEGPRGAAKILEMHPNTLRSRMEKLGIRRSGPRVS